MSHLEKIGTRCFAFGIVYFFLPTVFFSRAILQKVNTTQKDTIEETKKY